MRMREVIWRVERRDEYILRETREEMRLILRRERMQLLRAHDVGSDVR